VKDSIEKSATVLTCLLEFNSIQQALMFHDENSDQRKIMVTHRSSNAKDEETLANGNNSSELLSNRGSKELNLDQQKLQMGLRLGQKVNYRQTLILRSQLLEMRKTLLEKCEEVVDGTFFPFLKNNLKTQKIFNDLVQYHNEH
jgi:hypothetical protein